MIGRILRALRGEDSTTHDPDQATALAPWSDRLPQLWLQPDGSHPRPDLLVLSSAPVDVLCELCDSYWKSGTIDGDTSTGGACRLVRDSEVHCRALELLADGGRTAIDWARRRLRHTDYYARADAARLLGDIADRDQLAQSRSGVAHDLARLATRSVQSDNKEVIANTVALGSLAKIDDALFREAVGQILNSPEWDHDDLQGDAVELLSESTGEDFMATNDPLAAARAWIASHTPGL